MKLTVSNIKSLRRDSDNKLFRYVCSWVIGRWSDYSDKDFIFRDVLEHGCVSGMVSELIWYSQTTAFYKKYREQINELLKELMDGTGLYSMKDIFGKNWDNEDPLIIDTHKLARLCVFRVVPAHSRRDIFAHTVVYCYLQLPELDVTSDRAYAAVLYNGFYAHARTERK